MRFKINRTAPLAIRRSDEIDVTAGPLEVHGDGLFHILDMRHGGKQERPRDRDRSALVRVFIVKTVLAGNERRPVSNGKIVAPLGRAHKPAQTVRLVRVAPAEIVQDRDPLQAPADGNDLTDGLVDPRRRHGRPLGPGPGDVGSGSTLSITRPSSSSLTGAPFL